MSEDVFRASLGSTTSGRDAFKRYMEGVRAALVDSSPSRGDIESAKSSARQERWPPVAVIVISHSVFGGGIEGREASKPSLLSALRRSGCITFLGGFISLAIKAFCPSCQRFVYLDDPTTPVGLDDRGSSVERSCPVCSVPLVGLSERESAGRRLPSRPPRAGAFRSDVTPREGV
jgi:hypothetical protein